MIRLVLDTNQLVAGSLWPSGPAGFLLNVWRNRKIDIIVSPPILSEFENVLVVKFGTETQNADYAKRSLAYHGYFVDPQREITAIKDDPNDNRILEAAVEGKADAIVSRDKHLLSIGSSFEAIPIFPPEQAAEWVRKSI